jgi:hypothetical protein
VQSIRGPGHAWCEVGPCLAATKSCRATLQILALRFVLILQKKLDLLLRLSSSPRGFFPDRQHNVSAVRRPEKLHAAAKFRIVSPLLSPRSLLFKSLFDRRGLAERDDGLLLDLAVDSLVLDQAVVRRRSPFFCE